MKSHYLYFLATIFFPNNCIRADSATNPLINFNDNGNNYLFEGVDEELLLRTEANVLPAVEEDTNLSILMPSETENDAYFDNEFFITNYVSFVEFYDNVAMIFSFVKNDNSYFEHTTSYINAFKKIEDDLPDFTDEYNHDTYVKYLKICYESIYLYINFLNNEKNYTILDNYQKIFDKIHHKLIDIEAFFDLNCEYFDKIGLRLNFFEFNDFKNDVIHFKKLIDQEVEQFKCYNDFRKEKFQNGAISTASRTFEFLEIFRSRVDGFSNMSKDDFKEIENPFNDDHIKEITDLFLEIFINIKNYEKIISNLFDSLNNIGEFEYRYIARLKTIFGSYESN